MEYRTIRKDLFVSFYLNQGERNLIFISGMPSYITKYHPLVKFCNENKINLFIPRYYGSFESSGGFSIKSCIKTVQETVRLVKEGKVKELFEDKEVSWKNGSILVLGHSFGGLPTLCADLDSDIKIILSCPLVNLDMNLAEKGDAYRDLLFIEKAYPNLYRFKAEKLIQEYKKIKYPLKKEISLIVGKKDVSISKKEVDFLKEKYKPRVFEFEGGHSLDLNTLKIVLNV